MQTDQMLEGQALRVGEIVEVRSEAEILATLDARELESLPFMPEMLQFCRGARDRRRTAGGSALRCSRAVLTIHTEHRSWTEEEVR